MSICHTSSLAKFGHQTLNCPSIRYIVPAKIFSALPLCHKNWFCGKVRLSLFLSAAAYYSVHLDPYWCQKDLPGLLSTPPEKYGKKIVKHNFGMKNKIGRFFWATLYEKDWFTFDSSRWSKNDHAGLKMFFFIKYDENMCLVYQQTESVPEKAFVTSLNSRW